MKNRFIVSMISFVFVVSFFTFACASPCPLPESVTDVAINFQSFEWYSDYPTVIQEIENLELGKYQEHFNPNGGCTTPHWSIVKELANSFAGSETKCGGGISLYYIPNVAGYKNVYAQLYFIFTPGIGSYENISSSGAVQFYMAEYMFDANDKEACYNDLVEKLATIYGTTAYVWRNSSPYYTFWVNEEGAVVGVKNDGYDVSVYYCAPGSEEKLADIEKWVADSEIEKAKGDLSGL